MTIKRRNFVAKYLGRFNRPKVQASKKTYKRKTKHKEQHVDF